MDQSKVISNWRCLHNPGGQGNKQLWNTLHWTAELMALLQTLILRSHQIQSTVVIELWSQISQATFELKRLCQIFSILAIFLLKILNHVKLSNLALGHFDLYSAPVTAVLYAISDHTGVCLYLHWTLHTVQCCYNTINFRGNPNQRHSISHPLGWALGCLLWIQILI